MQQRYGRKKQNTKTSIWIAACGVETLKHEVTP
jgi:sulfite reductase beta subunit-like hemoprotein